MKAQRAGTVLDVHAVQHERVDVHVQIQGGAEALDDRDSPAATVCHAVVAGAAPQEPEGMVTSDNLELWRSRGQGYLVGLNRRRRAEIVRYIEAATGPWIDCPVGITAREKAEPPKTQVQEVAADHGGIRIFVVRSDEREQLRTRAAPERDGASEDTTGRGAASS